MLEPDVFCLYVIKLKKVCHDYRPQTKFAKVMFLQVSVCPREGACMVVGGHAWLQGGMRGCQGCAWLQGGMPGCQGACVVVGGACMVAGGVCMVARGHVWLRGCVVGGSVCMVAGGVRGCWGGVCGCQGACVVVGGACMVAGVCVHGCQRACVVAGMCGWWEGVHGCWGVCVVAWGTCVVAGGHAWLRGACIGYDEIRSMSGRYAFYWNAFLLIFNFVLNSLTWVSKNVICVVNTIHMKFIFTVYPGFGYL